MGTCRAFTLGGLPRLGAGSPGDTDWRGAFCGASIRDWAEPCVGRIRAVMGPGLLPSGQVTGRLGCPPEPAPSDSWRLPTVAFLRGRCARKTVRGALFVLRDQCRQAAGDLASAGGRHHEYP